MRNGPRVIDIDILMYDAVEISTEVLRIPHPGMLERSTVLVPLNDIAHSVRHVLTGRTVGYHLALLGPITGHRPLPARPAVTARRGASHSGIVVPLPAIRE